MTAAQQDPPTSGSVVADDHVDDLLYRAWTIICNVDNGDWEQQPSEWRATVLQYRDAYHDWLNRTTQVTR